MKEIVIAVVVVVFGTVFKELKDINRVHQMK